MPSASVTASAPIKEVPTPPTDAEQKAIAAVLSRGTAHAPAVRVPAVGPDASWVVFVGTKTALFAPWIVSGAAPDAPSPVEVPRFTRVVGAIVRGKRAHVLVESVAAFDQPKGAFAVLSIEPSGKRVRIPELMGVATLVELEARLARPISIHVEPDILAREAALKVADASVEGLGAQLSKDGVEIVQLWQGELAKSLGHADASTLAASPHLAAMREVLHKLSGGCDAVCPNVTWVKEGTRVVLRQIELRGGDVALPPATAKPSIVQPSKSVKGKEAARAALAKISDKVIERVVAEAPLTAAGGVFALVELQGQQGLSVVVEDPDAVALVDLDPSVEAPKYDHRFADLDGDGRTDLVLEAKGKFIGKPHVVRRGHRAARVVDSPVKRDESLLLALRGGTLDEGVARALALGPSKPVSVAEACALLASATSAATFAKVAKPNATLLSYQEPGMPTYAPMTHTRKNFAWNTLRPPTECRVLQCDPERPVCFDLNPPGLDFFFFGWTAGKAQITAIERYSGS